MIEIAVTTPVGGCWISGALKLSTGPYGRFQSRLVGDLEAVVRVTWSSCASSALFKAQVTGNVPSCSKSKYSVLGPRDDQVS